MMRELSLCLKTGRLLVAVLALSALALPAQANLIKNGSFETVNSPNGPNTNFLITPNSTSQLSDWMTTSGASVLIRPGTATTPINGISLWPGCGPNSTVSSCNAPVTSFPYQSPSQGNFIGVDGDYLTGTLQQTVSGLVPNAFYLVSFWQMAAQLNDQANFCCSGATTEQWLVTLSDGTNTESHLSTLMKNGSQNFVDWNRQTMKFKATSATEIIGFFAIGTPVGVPPAVLLDGVSMFAVAEPQSLALLGVGLLGLLAFRQPRRASIKRP